MGEQILMSVSETVKALGISQSTLLRQVKKNMIPSIKLGRRRLFNISSILENLAEQSLSPNETRGVQRESAPQ